MTDDLESVYADDVMHGCLHESPAFVLAAVQFTAEQMLRVTKKYGLLLNFCAGANNEQLFGARAANLTYLAL